MCWRFETPHVFEVVGLSIKGATQRKKAPISQSLNRNSVSNRDAAGQLDYLTLIVMGLPSSPTWKTTILVASFALKFLARMVCPISAR